MGRDKKPSCLKMVPERDLQIRRTKTRRETIVLKVRYGGTMLCNQSVTFCGLPLMRAGHILSWKERARVTCPRCRQNMLARFPETVNPRSGMAMPRPAARLPKESEVSDEQE